MSKLNILAARFVDANETVATLTTSEGEITIGERSPAWPVFEDWREAGGVPSSPYEIVSARWANPQHTAAEAITAEFGAVLVTMEKPALWLRLQAFIWTAGNTVAEYDGPAGAEEP
jgi:hypothetical protein